MDLRQGDRPYMTAVRLAGLNYNKNAGWVKMVKLYKFHCDACGYEAIVSGENGRDEISSGFTIFCEDCRQLYEIEDQGSYTIKQKAFYKKARCPESFTHRFRIWTHPGACPKCGKPMQKGDLVVSWD